MSSYDDSGKTGHRSAYVIEKGVYGFAIGANVRDARRAWAFTQAETVVLEQLEEAAAPAEPFFILTAKEVDGVHVPVQEPVHTRTVDLKQKILQSLPAGVPITGDRGYRLDDVKAGKVTLDALSPSSIRLSWRPFQGALI